jgi:hypothetical protein
MTLDSKKDVTAILKESMQNLEWFSENCDVLKQKYNNQWVIIENRQVVKSSSTYNEIRKNAENHKESALLKFITSEQISMFF